MDKRNKGGSGSLNLTGRQRRQFIKRAALTAAGSTVAASMLDSFIGPQSAARAQAVLNWPVHSPPYLSIAPGVGGYGLNTTAGSGRHQSPPNPSIFFVNSLSNANSGALAPAYGPNTYTGTLEFAVRHAASPKKIYLITSGYVIEGRPLPIQTGEPPRPGYVSIIGQTAPAPGMFIRGTRLSTNGASNVHISHVRLYMGDDPLPGGYTVRLPNGQVVDAGDNRDCLQSGYGGGVTSNMVFENCEFAFGIDELVDLYLSHATTSFLQCAFLDPLHDSVIEHTDDPEHTDHGFGPIIGGGSDVQSDTITIFRCLFANMTGRAPLSTCQRMTMANNVFYNVGADAIRMRNGEAAVQQPQYLNALYNLFIRGPNSGTNLIAVRANTDLPAASRCYVAGNAAKGGWTASSQPAFVRDGPPGFVSSSLLPDAYPVSWGSGLSGVLQWVANPAAATNAEAHAIIDLIGRTVGAQPGLANRKGRMPIVLQQMHDRINGGSTQSQYIDTVAQAGGWEALGSQVIVDPLNPGAHWHAPFPTGANRNTPYTSGTFSDGKSRVGYTPLDEFDYEQKLYVMG
jgi:hypothetical protein